MVKVGIPQLKSVTNPRRCLIQEHPQITVDSAAVILTQQSFNLSDDLPTGAGAFLPPALFLHGTLIKECRPMDGIFSTQLGIFAGL